MLRHSSHERTNSETRINTPDSLPGKSVKRRKRGGGDIEDCPNQPVQAEGESGTCGNRDRCERTIHPLHALTHVYIYSVWCPHQSPFFNNTQLLIAKLSHQKIFSPQNLFYLNQSYIEPSNMADIQTNQTREYGDLIVTMTSDYTWRWDDRGSGADRDGGFWHAKA